MKRVDSQEEKRNTKKTELSWRMEWLKWGLRSLSLSSMLVTLLLASTTQNISTFLLRNFTRSCQTLVWLYKIFYKILEGFLLSHLLDQVIYPGKVTEAPCFRIGNIGHVTTKDMDHLLNCIKAVLKEMHIPLPVVWLSD